jgi:hypothetical protein
MYRENVAPDPGNLPREYGGSSAGTGVFCVPAGAGKGVPARKRRQPSEDLFFMLFIAQDRLRTSIHH